MALSSRKMKLRSSKFSNSNGVKSSPYDTKYFTWPHPLLGTFIIALLLYLIVTTVSATSIPDFLWPFAQIGKYMATEHFNLIIVICVLTVIAHSLEAAYAGKVCHDRRYSVSTTIKWTASTFVFGFPSMIRLLSIKPRSKHT